MKANADKSLMAKYLILRVIKICAGSTCVCPGIKKIETGKQIVYRLWHCLEYPANGTR